MGYNETVSEESFHKIECYVCTIYGKPKLKLVNETKLDIFFKKYKTKSKDEVIKFSYNFRRFCILNHALSLHKK